MILKSPRHVHTPAEYWIFFGYRGYHWTLHVWSAGPSVWNNQPTDFRQRTCHTAVFRQSPKTFLFGQWDQSALWTCLTAL